jgi:hypothetical protein
VAEAAADGVRVPGYEILAILGRGGMGVVYRARDVKLNRVVALKMVLSGAHAGENELARFRNEAEAVARLQHANVVQVYEVGEHNGLPFLALELCPGGSLARKLGGTPMAPREAAALVEPLARAMHAAHQKGVVHRDLTPGNVLFGEDGTPKVTDFGLARKLDPASPGGDSGGGLTVTGAVLGTPSYMAPEQARGQKDVGPPADVYALGAVLYECLTGRPPFKAETTLETLHQVIDREPAPPRLLQPGVPRDLETVCLKGLHKEPQRRYASAQALADDLRRFLQGEPIQARPVGRLERAWKWARRRPAAAALLGVSALAVVALVGVIGTAAALLYGKNVALESANKELGRLNADLTAERNRATTEAEERARREKEAREARELAENTLVDGLLRPIGHHGGQANFDPAEKQALEDLARLPDEGLRLRFVERGLASPETAYRLGLRGDEIAVAVAGGDAGRRQRLRDLALPRLLDAEADWRVRFAGARLGLALREGDPRFARAAAVALLEAMARVKDNTAGDRPTQSFSAVAQRLRPEEARDVALAVAALPLSATGPEFPPAMHFAFGALGPRLDAAGRRDAGRAVVRLIPTAPNPASGWLARTVADLVPHMDAADATALSAEAAAALLAAPPGQADPNDRARRVEGLRALAPRLPPEAARDAGREAVARLRAATDPAARVATAKVISDLALRMKPDQASAVCADAAAVLLGGIDKGEDVRARAPVAQEIASLTRYLDADGARGLAVPLLTAFTKEPVEPGPSGGPFTGPFGGPLGGGIGPGRPVADRGAGNSLLLAASNAVERLDGRGADETAQAAVDLMGGKPWVHLPLARFVVTLAPRLNRDRAAVVGDAAFKTLLADLELTGGGDRAELPRVILALVPYLGARAAGEALRKVVELTARSADQPRADFRTLAAALAARLDAPVVADAARSAVGLIPRTAGPAVRADLARLVAALAPAAGADGARACAAAVAVLLDSQEKEREPQLREMLDRAVADLAPRLDSDGAAAGAATLLAALPREKNEGVRLGHGRALAALAPRMRPEEADRVCARAVALLLDGFADVEEYGRVQRAFVVAALAPYLAPASARDTAAALVAAIGKEPRQDTRPVLAGIVVSLAPSLDAKGAHDVAAVVLAALPKDRFLHQRAAAVAALASRMEADEAEQACAAAAADLFAAVPNSRNQQELDLSAEATFVTLVEGLGRRMGPRRARETAEAGVDLLPKAAGFPANQALLAAGVAALAPRMKRADAEAVAAAAADKLLAAQASPTWSGPRSPLARAVAVLAPHMESAAADRACARAADELLKRLKVPANTSDTGTFLAWAALAERLPPGEVADLLTRNEPPPYVVPWFLAPLERLACRHFETIDEAVKWFRAPDPAPPKA